MSKQRELDQFYTQPGIAQRCVEAVSRWLEAHRPGIAWEAMEPSAGAGVFLRSLETIGVEWVAYDIDPKDSQIQQADFLQLDHATWANEVRHRGRVPVVIGNPPFGKNASKALAFFNRSASFADVVAFILPRTFEKVSMQNRMDLAFTLEEEVVLPIDAFLFNGEPYAVPCVFQIWVRGATPRQRIRTLTRHQDWEFVRDRSRATVAMQRVGVAAGTIKPVSDSIASASHYFLRTKDQAVIERLKRIDWSHVKYKTAGNPSISKHELIEAYMAEKSRGKSS